MAAIVGDSQRTAAAFDVEVIWAEAAEADLRQIHDFIATDNPTAARAVAQAIMAAANGLAEYPLKGHTGTGGMREWLVPTFAATFSSMTST